MSNTELVHISQIAAGDTVEHYGEIKTVSQGDLKNSEFMGITLFGDSYKLGRELVKRIKLTETDFATSQIEKNNFQNTPDYYTFSAEGLSVEQIEFLKACEHLYFTQDTYNMSGIDIIKQALSISQTSYVDSLQEAWEYWKNTPKPVYKDSLKTPVKITELMELQPTQDKNKLFVHISTHNADDQFKALKYGRYIGTPIGLINVSGGKLGEMSGDNMYFEISGNRLYMKYQQIIGSRYIADICL